MVESYSSTENNVLRKELNNNLGVIKKGVLQVSVFVADFIFNQKCQKLFYMQNLERMSQL